MHKSIMPTVGCLILLAIAGIAAPEARGQEALYPRVLQIGYNPILENQGGVRLNVWAGWNPPGPMGIQYVADMSDATHGLVNFRIERFIHADEYPLKTDGFRYSDATYVAAAQTGNWHSPDSVDYRAIARNFDLARKVDSGELDEVFVDGAPYFGYYESRMAGIGGYWCNSPPLPRVPCSKIFVMMGFNYERGVAEMLHSCGHRSESIMEHTYGFWDITKARHDWERFTHNIGQSPDAACGTVHWPPNAAAGYDYGNTRVVTSTAIDWMNNYPNLTGQTSSVSRATWGGPDYHRNFMKWWYSHMPHLDGRNNHDGYNRLNNWYAYIFDFNRYPESGGNHAPGGTPPAATPNIATPARLSNNLHDDWQPRINAEGRVVWHGSDGADFEIYSANRDGTGFVQVTANTRIDEDPQINALGRIVWQAFDGQDYEIFSANADGTDVVQITNNAVNDWHPQINDNNRIVWDRFDGNDFEIYTAMADGTGIFQVTNNHADSGQPRDDVWPQISNTDRIAWFGHDGSDWEIFSANADGTGLVNVSNDFREDVYPRINNAGRIVWFRYESDNNTEIMSAPVTGGSVVRITSNTYFDWAPEINDAGTVVWMGRPSTQWEIYSASALGGPITLRSNNANHDQYPRIDADGRIAWQGFDGNDWEIYGWDGTTIYQITDNDYDDRWPDLSDAARIVWHAHSVQTAGGNRTEIYAAPLGPYWDDADLDGLPDDWEMEHFQGLGHSPATDEEPDGLSNQLEYENDTDPLDPDSDDDGATDGDEVLVYESDPLDPDSDDDGLLDGAEIAAGTGLLDSDSDDDGLPDGWEVQYGLDPLADDADLDLDNDGHSNLVEFQANSDPTLPWSIPTPPAAGSALAFDGIDDYLSLGNVAVSGGVLTIEAWVRPDIQGSARILEKFEDYSVQLTAGNLVRFMTRYGFTWDILDGQVACPPGEWTHIACVMDGSTKRIYINGEPDTDGAYSQSIKVTTNNLIAGASSPDASQGRLDGTIDDIRVWNVARTQAQIQGAMNGVLEGNEPGLVGYWDLEEGFGQVAGDALGQHDGQLGASGGADASDPTWVGSSVALNPTAGQGPVISSIDHPEQAGIAAPIIVTAQASDAASGNDGVTSMTLFFGVEWPHNAYSVAGVGPGGSGDGSWTFEIPALGPEFQGQTLRFFLRADDGDGNPTFAINGGALYAIAIASGLPSDADGDGDVDLADWAALSDCLVGPDLVPGDAGCAIFDGDGDNDVDLEDVAAFTRAFTGE